MTALGVLCCLPCLFVCLFDLACFFLPSFSSHHKLDGEVIYIKEYITVQETWGTPEMTVNCINVTPFTMKSTSTVHQYYLKVGLKKVVLRDICLVYYY